jgi:hypothetical protein
VASIYQIIYGLIILKNSLAEKHVLKEIIFYTPVTIKPLPVIDSSVNKQYFARRENEIMPMQDAQKLIFDMRGDSELRKGAYLCADGKAFKSYLESHGYDFQDHEFENAANSMRLKAGNMEEAAELMEIRQWYTFMRGS